MHLDFMRHKRLSYTIILFAVLELYLKCFKTIPQISSALPNTSTLKYEQDLA